MQKSIQGKTGVLLVNLGTPNSTSTSDVRKYLREFLMDKRVIDIPFISRWLLVNLIIAPFRSPKSAAEYRKLWVERGSPLKFYGEDVRDLLANKLSDEYVVALGMRYQEPSIQSALEILKSQHVAKIIVIPLFPQYASASSGSVHDKVMEIVQKWQVIPQMNFISNFVEEPGFYKTFAALGKKHLDRQSYDHVLFSFHGLPERQIKKGSDGNYCQLGKCCNTYHDKNRYCYRAQCFLTARLIAKELGLTEDNYTVTFQSRLGNDPWIKPYTDIVLKDLAKAGKKSVLAFSPAFVADCLETTVEVGETFKEDFLEAGGENWDLVESLNDNDDWIETLKDMVLKN
ncbi:ferrochelatase [Marivirga sp. S37H4]|uniref:Ferrochelatase n=1 Tax=Marivirga aurantiaca TaxID=2802615 RepID=A0A935C9H3_9BACT|nr:ferrochelatase [Marivirga aurantiaca]MBK6265989.1 ferrochelatase [Marivirga aurantiaca]